MNESTNDPTIEALNRRIAALEARTEGMQLALHQAAQALQQFRRDWQQVPQFGDRVNRATREAIGAALSPLVNLDAVGGPLDLARHAPPDAGERPDSELLNALQDRPRMLGRDEAHHPATVQRVLGALDASGPSEAGDVIHSLLWRCAILDNRAQRFAKELMARSGGGAAEEPATMSAKECPHGAQYSQMAPAIVPPDPERGMRESFKAFCESGRAFEAEEMQARQGTFFLMWREAWEAARQASADARGRTPADLLLVLEQVSQQNERLQEICAAAYQMAGVFEAPVRFLDALSNPMDATREQIEALLPVSADEEQTSKNALQAELWQRELTSLPGYDAPLVFERYSVADFHKAPSGEGPKAAEWQDKPHRLLYDLCRTVLVLYSGTFPPKNGKGEAT